MRVVNLSRRPFVNDRPVVRLAALLWVLGAVLLAVNITSYTNYWIDSAEIRTELAGIESDIRREQQSFSDIKRRFQRLDLAAMNQQTAFLNGLIRDRTFPWSVLFEDLEDVLAFDVKLDSLRPELSEDPQQTAVRPPAVRRVPSRRRSTEAPPPAPPPPPTVEEVDLSLQGTAKSGEAILDFVDALFAHPAFRQPKLLRESLNEQTGLVAFEIRTLYRIKTAQDEAIETADGAAGDAAPAAGGLGPAAPAGQPAAGEPEEIEVGSRDPEAMATPAAGRPSPGGEAQSSGAGRATAGREPAATITSAPPPPRDRAGTPAAGTPAAGTPAAGTVLIGTAAPPPQASPGPPPAARPPVSRAPTTSAADDPAPAGTGDDPRARPRFVEPSASDAARLEFPPHDGAGGSRP